MQQQGPRRWHIAAGCMAVLAIAGCQRAATRAPAADAALASRTDLSAPVNDWPTSGNRGQPSAQGHAAPAPRIDPATGQPLAPQQHLVPEGAYPATSPPADDAEIAAETRDWDERQAQLQARNGGQPGPMPSTAQVSKPDPGPRGPYPQDASGREIPPTH